MTAMADLSRFAALAASNGVVPRFPRPFAARGTTEGTEIIQQYQYYGHSVPLVPRVPRQNNDILRETDLMTDFEERAAIMEYDGGMSRREAEALAEAEVFGTGARGA